MAPESSVLAVSTVVFDGHGWDVAFDTLADLGLRWIEPAFIDGYVDFDEADFAPAAAAQFAKALSDRGLTSQAISAHVDMGLPDAAEKLRRRVRFAADIGATAVITNATQRTRSGAFRATLETVLPTCRAHGITLRLENPGHGAGSLLPDGATAAALVREIGEPELGINYDLGNSYTYNGGVLDLAADLEAALAARASMHLKDVREAGPDWEFCAVGAGLVGYRAALDRLGTLDRPIYLGVELPLRLCRPNHGDPIRRARPLDLGTIRQVIAESCQSIRSEKVR